MNKPKLLHFFLAFLLGFLVSGCVAVFLTSHAVTRIIEADTLALNYYRPNILQRVKDYDDAQKFWPFLLYNKLFTTTNSELKISLAQLKSQAAIKIYLKDPFTNEDVSLLTKQIQTIQGVTIVTFISKEDALTTYKAQHKNDKLLLSLATPDILPASLEVYVSDQTIKNQIETLAKNKPFVSSVTKTIDY